MMVLQEEAMTITDHRGNVKIIITREVMIVRGLQEVARDPEAETTEDLIQVHHQAIPEVLMTLPDHLIIREIQITPQDHLKVQEVLGIVPDHLEVQIPVGRPWVQAAVLQVRVAEVLHRQGVQIVEILHRQGVQIVEILHRQGVQIVEVLQVPEILATIVPDIEDNN
jgi:hypothetical protein